MKKVLTLFCALVVTFLTAGVAKAQTTYFPSLGSSF